MGGFICGTEIAATDSLMTSQSKSYSLSISVICLNYNQKGLLMEVSREVTFQNDDQEGLIFKRLSRTEGGFGWSMKKGSIQRKPRPKKGVSTGKRQHSVLGGRGCWDIQNIKQCKQYQRQQSMIMNLKYNRIDMKNKAREHRCSMKLRQRPALAQKTRVYRKKSIREKRSPPTRDFGTDLTNRPEAVATPVETSYQASYSSPPEITPYLSHIVDHLTNVDQKFTSRVVARLASSSEMAQSKVSPQMRKVLLKWLLQVSRKFQVKDETLQICVQLIDLTLLYQTNLISKQNFQLLGVSALFVASKYNQIHTYQADKYVYLCDGLYTLQQLFEMESLILTTTNFNMQFPSLHQFTGLVIQHYSLQIDTTVNELIKLSLFDFMLCNRFQKQHLAAVIIYFAIKINECSVMRSKDIIQELGVPEQIFRECFMVLLGLYRSRQELQ